MLSANAPPPSSSLNMMACGTRPESTISGSTRFSASFPFRSANLISV